MGWIGMTLCTDVHVHPRMNSNDFGDHLPFHQALSSGKHFNLSKTLVNDQIPAEQITFPQALAVTLYLKHNYLAFISSI